MTTIAETTPVQVSPEVKAIHRRMLRRHRLTQVEPLGDLGMGDVPRHDEGTGQRQSGLDRVAAQLREVHVAGHEDGRAPRAPG